MANYLTNNNPQRPQWLRLITLLILFTILLLTLTSCRSSRTTIHSDHQTTDTLYRYINTANHNTLAHTDTIHDSILIREVVNEQGETKYKERTIYRNHIGQTIIRTNTIHDTIQAAQHHQTTTNTATKATTPSHHSWGTILLTILLFLALAYALKAYSAKH